MIYEGTVQFVAVDDNGNDKQTKESVILENCDTFSEAESRLYETYDRKTAFDVIALKRSNLKEVANTRSDADEKIFVAVVCDTFTDDSGKEKEMSYRIAFFSPSIDNAKNFIDQYLKQGYDMKLKSLQETKFANVNYG